MKCLLHAALLGMRKILENPDNKQLVILWKNKYWYFPIALILFSGYLLGGYLWFGVNFMDLFSSIENPTGRNFLGVFFGGIIGGTLYCSYFFAKDANDILGGIPKKKGYPNFIDPFLYLLLIVGGGFTAIILVAAVKAGFLMLSTPEPGATLGQEATWVLSIGGGFATHSVKMFLLRLVDKTIKKVEKGLKEPKPTAAKTKAKTSSAKSKQPQRK